MLKIYGEVKNLPDGWCLHICNDCGCRGHCNKCGTHGTHCQTDCVVFKGNKN